MVCIILLIAERDACACPLVFQHVVGQASLYLLGKLSGIILCIAFQDGFKDNTGWRVFYVLFGRQYLDSILFQFVLIDSRVIATAREAV